MVCRIKLAMLWSFLVLSSTVSAAELHVAVNGKDDNAGTREAPFRTIQHAADAAQPGDTITVHEGVYRERINPPRGGESDAKRIIYQAAPGEKVEIKGSEVAKNWEKVQDDVWKTVIPNSFFGGFNPYSDLIRGDWFDPRGRQHHTGAVYLNGEWLTEAAKLENVLKGATAAPAATEQYLLNLAWLRPRSGVADAKPVRATAFAAQQGTQNAPNSEGGECVGWIEPGDWIRYERVDFGERTEEIEFRAASETEGGRIEVHLDKPDGELLGECIVPNTGGWQSWRSFKAKLKAVNGIKTVCLVFTAPPAGGAATGLWFAQVDATNTTIQAQFKGVNPNEQLVEINVRRTVFYPEKPGRNFITVRGFTMRHAATPWAPPTAEQIGLIGTHWSKGWIIERNTISHSVCSGIALGKHGDQYDNTSANSAEGYVKTIERAHAFSIPWTKEQIGHHIVRDNTISHCEQTGIVGSLGPVFSAITNNTIHDIHVRRLFSGAEMAGIKLHAAIDVTIRGNHIYRTNRGLWLDWMAQGTRVSGNLFHDNIGEDLFVEVNHGPFLVDNNLFLSATTLRDWSEGGAYVHNLIAGKITVAPQGRQTPYHPAHGTAVAGLKNVKCGEDRFYNNLFVGTGLAAYDKLALFTGGNVYFHGAKPYAKENNHIEQPGFNPQIKLERDGAKTELRLNLDASPSHTGTVLVTTELLGKAAIPQVGYENPDGSPLKIDADYFGKPRDATHPTAGPFEAPGTGAVVLKVR